jgi:octaprenyl-diphosphate synthase
MRLAPSDSITSARIFQLIEPELRDVEVRLKEEAVSSLGLVDQMNQYLHDSGGKRLRPSLLLLVSKHFGFSGEASLRLGVVVELIHVATLVHDDIIDRSLVRRGRPSLNAKWGNEVTVLFGDWLYMTAFWIALKEENFRILDILIDITRKMVEGELLQLEQNHRLDVTADDHLSICWHKTAHLFSGCARLGAILAGCDSDSEERLADYGEALGMAFQLTDDLLDYTADQQVLGKPVLKDLEEGNVTLPIINLLKKVTPNERQFIEDVVAERDFGTANKTRIMELVNSYGAIQDARESAREYAIRAADKLGSLKDSVYKEALLELPNSIISREK